MNPCGNSPYVTSSLTRRWGCLLWRCLAFRQLYVWHIWHVIENFSFCTTHKSSISTGFTEQIMPILRILCYNGSLVTWTVVGLTTAKFKPLLLYDSENRKRRDQQFFCSCMCIRCRGNAFTHPLPRNIQIQTQRLIGGIYEVRCTSYRYRQTHRQQSDHISLHFFFQNKESTLKNFTISHPPVILFSSVCIFSPQRIN
jgi:hypothetical protein